MSDIYLHSNNQVRIGVEMLNVNEVYALLDDLSNLEKDRAIKQALRRAGGVFIAGGKSRLRERTKKGKTGNLLSSFKINVKRRKLGALVGFSSPKGNHSWLVDRGTVQRYTRSGKNRGIMPANYFWDDTRKQDGGKAIDVLKIGIEQAVARIKSRH